jgi:hypothetical protein
VVRLKPRASELDDYKQLNSLFFSVPVRSRTPGSQRQIIPIVTQYLANINMLKNRYVLMFYNAIVRNDSRTMRFVHELREERQGESRHSLAKNIGMFSILFQTRRKNNSGLFFLP